MVSTTNLRREGSLLEDGVKVCPVMVRMTFKGGTEVYDTLRTGVYWHCVCGILVLPQGSSSVIGINAKSCISGVGAGGVLFAADCSFSPVLDAVGSLMDLSPQGLCCLISWENAELLLESLALCSQQPFSVPDFNTEAESWVYGPLTKGKASGYFVGGLGFTILKKYSRSPPG